MPPVCSLASEHMSVISIATTDITLLVRVFAQTRLRIVTSCAASGTPTTAVLAARIAQPQYIALMEVSPEMEDALDAAEARVAAAKREADKSKSAAAARQSVRQDMRLRAKV